MSTLNVSNITDGTTTVDTSYVLNGSAKAWVNFDGTGTIATRDSLNVASLTDNNIGNYTINLSSSIIDTNQSTQATSHSGQDTFFNHGASSYLDTSSSIRMMAIAASTAAATDKNVCSSSVHGDLA